MRNSLAVTATGTNGQAVTATLPAVPDRYHYITEIQVVKFAVAALSALAAPKVVTTTNLPGSPALTFQADAAAQGTAHVQTIEPALPLKSIDPNTDTTVVCPASTNVIWRVNVFYNVER